MIIKPATLGSSIGISVAENQQELEKGLFFASKYDNEIIVEKYIKDVTEINVAVYKGVKGLVVSECEMPVTKNSLLTFEDKYSDGDRVFPAPIEKRLADRFKKIAREVYEKLNFKGVIRIDFLLKDNQIYLNEINSVPGSLSYYLFCNTLAEFTKMLDEIIEQSLVEFNKKQSTIKRFESNILSIKGSKGGKRL